MSDTVESYADLPEQVRPFARAIEEQNRQLGLESDPSFVRTIAWMRWVRSFSNEELADWLVLLRTELFHNGENLVSVRLMEIQDRLRKGRKK